MQEAKLQYFKERLLQKKQETQELLKRLNEGGFNKSLQDSISELSSYDNHPADLGEEMFERSKDLALKDNALIQLDKIEDALAKISNRTYGTCEYCRQPIPEERLEAIPETTVCLKCRQISEGKGDRHPRPMEEDVISPPFGGLMHDDASKELGDAEDEIMFDGEDAWQDVARFGTSDTPSDIGNVLKYPDVYMDFDEDRGTVEDVEAIPYEKGKDGMIYKSFKGVDDETEPEGSR